MRAMLHGLKSRRIMIVFAALLAVGLMAGLAFAESDSELPDISGSRPTAFAPLVNEPLPNDSSEPGLPFTETDDESEESDEADEDSDDHSTVGSETVYEREDTDD